jgi:hypothetical protein
MWLNCVEIFKNMRFVVFHIFKEENRYVSFGFQKMILFMGFYPIVFQINVTDYDMLGFLDHHFF